MHDKKLKINMLKNYFMGEWPHLRQYTTFGTPSLKEIEIESIFTTPCFFFQVYV